MPADMVRVRLVLDTPDGDQERVEEDLQFLLDELSQIDTESIERESVGTAPPGTRGDGLNAAGALLIALGSSGATLPVLVGLVRDWLTRRGSGAVRLKIGSDEVELSHVSTATQQRVLEEFLSRHQE
jgi:Effector Associated Constant Component 1